MQVQSKQQNLQLGVLNCYFPLDLCIIIVGVLLKVLVMLLTLKVFLIHGERNLMVLNVCYIC